MSKVTDQPHAMQPEDTPELRALYRGFEENHLNPLWTQTANLMPPHPKPEAVAHIWEWEKLYDLAKQSGDLVPVGRGGNGARLVWQTLGWVVAPIFPRHFGLRCNIWDRVRMHQSIVMRKTHFVSY